MAQEDDISSKLEMARTAFANKDAIAASQSYIQVLSDITPESPHYPECLERLTFIYKVSGDYQTAAEFCYELVRSGSEHLGASHPKVQEWKALLAEISVSMGPDYGSEGSDGDSGQVETVSAQEHPGFAQEEAGLAQSPPDYVQHHPGFSQELPQPSGYAQQNSGAQSVSRAQSFSRAAPAPEPPPPEPDPEQAPPASSRAPKSNLKTAEMNLSNLSSARKVLEKTQILSQPSIVVGYLVTGLSLLYAMIVTLLLVYHTYVPFFIPEVKFTFSKPNDTADGLKNFLYTSNKSAQFSENNHGRQMPYRAFGLSFDDFVASLTPTLWRREFWIQDNGVYIRDEDDTVFIAEHSPESIILDEMQKLAKACQEHFESHHQYPETISELDESALRYLNPYTERKDIPLLQQRTAEQPDRQKADEFINSILKEMSAGRKYNNEPAVYPGAINACVLNVSSPNKMDRVLIIHGCISTGQFLSNSGYKRTFLIAHRNGEDLRYVNKVDPFGRSLFWVTPGFEWRPSFLCVLKSPGECFIPLKLFRYRGILGFFIIGLGYLLLLRFSAENTKTRRFNEIMVLVSLACIVLSFFNSVLP